jgi:dTDP-4-amino-4,6-dideoxygalactose transaminase
MTWRIPLSDIDFGPEELTAVQEVLASRWLTMGSITQEFERSFANYVGTQHAIAVTNATAGLHLACLAVHIGTGDEVIVPSLTFVATSNAVLYAGGIPVFADIVDETDLNISPKSIEEYITPRTRAVIVVHYGGYACDMRQIMALAQKYHLYVIEDAAHAIGSELDGKKLGTVGDIGCFSFFSNKNMTTGEGGMLVTNDDNLAEKLRLMRSHGMTSLTWDRHQGHAWDYDVVALGYNYRIDEMRSALGLVQLEKLERNNERRRQLTLHYREALQELTPEIGIPFEDHRGISAAHLMPILLPKGVKRNEFMRGMKEKGIQTSHHYPPIHRFSAYQNNPIIPLKNLPVTDEISEREVTLPLYPTLSDEDVLVVVEAIKSSLTDTSSLNG